MDILHHAVIFYFILHKEPDLKGVQCDIMSLLHQYGETLTNDFYRFAAISCAMQRLQIRGIFHLMDVTQAHILEVQCKAVSEMKIRNGCHLMSCNIKMCV